MLWFRKCPSQIPLFPILSLSFSSSNTSFQHNNHHFLNILNNSPVSQNVAFQIHSNLTTNGSFNHFSNTQIIFLFNTLLRHYTLTNSPKKAIFFYKQVQGALLSFHFDSFTYSFLIKACAFLKNQNLGIQFHAHVVKMGFEWHVYVQSALINMYVGFGFLGHARKVFDEMPERNLVTWNVIVTGFAKLGYIEAALGLFWEMPRRNIVSWTGMIDGCTNVKKYFEAFSLFREMVVFDGIMPSEVTVLTIFPAIADLGDLKNCRLVHGYGYKTGFNEGAIRVMNSLVDTYAKCGCIKSALKVFHEMDGIRRNLVSWTSIICGFAMHGMAKEAGECFERMKSFGFKPNRVTFLGVLTACSHGGLVEEGLQFFRKMTDDCELVPDIKHYGCLIDMMGRAGKLKEAEEMACEIPNYIDNVIIWRTLLGACSFYGDTEMAECVTTKIHEMEKEYGGDYVLMSNILTGHGKFSEAENIRALMDEKSVQKMPAHSF